MALASQRFSALKALSDNGIFAGLLLMPVLPFLEDNEENIQEIIKGAVESGAKFIYAAFGVTLRENQREWYFDQLDTHFPGIKEKYIKQYGNSYQCSSAKGKELWGLFTSQCHKEGLFYKMQDIIAAYKAGYGQEQLTLF